MSVADGSVVQTTGNRAADEDIEAFYRLKEDMLSRRKKWNQLLTM
jgi:hypothetical protein